MQIEDISTLLRRDSSGIYASSGAREVSYASHGHAECFGVEDRSFWFVHRNNCISSVVKHHPPEHGPILDIGGGNGYVAQRLVSDGWEVVLLEPGMDGARNARLHRNLQHVVRATVEDAGFLPGIFGAIGMFDVIEHIEDDTSFLERISPLLRPNGRLYLTVPCHQWLWSQADVDAGHFRRHTASSLKQLLDPLFSIDYLSFFFRPLVLPQYLLRALPYRLHLGRERAALSTESEHGSNGGLAVDVVNRLLRNEASRIAAGERIGFGASCLVAATKR
ncbi:MULTISPECIES: class I SAM-dependent methyltransferase [Luteimonas]|uniref:class I SAM-dependent methyltransferase n=1 Tax=Luteimonas TaxID=83614 RepID=UPI000C7BB31D|nr:MULTISPECIES: class I SAM-dependent methyltransferase [Luteimonas]